MKQVYLSGPKELTTKEVPVPEATGSQVLIKTKAAGICGTDIHSYMGESIFGKLFPFHIGHEVAGIVEAVGPDCVGTKPGDHVVIDPLIACGVCEACRQGKSNYCSHNTSIGRTGPGGFSDYILMPESSVYTFDPGLDYVTACLAEPLACVIHGVERARVSLGQTVLVKGAGSIGQLHMLVSRFAGASVVAMTDFNTQKLEQAKKLGADHIFDAKAEDFEARVRKIAPDGFDVVIDCTGAQASVQSAIPYVKSAGTLLIFGVCPRSARINVSPHEVYIREISVVGSFAFPKDTLLKALRFLTDRRITRDQVVAAVLPREQLEQAINDVAEGAYGGKVVISTED